MNVNEIKGKIKQEQTSVSALASLWYKHVAVLHMEVGLSPTYYISYDKRKNITHILYFL